MLGNRREDRLQIVGQQVVAVIEEGPRLGGGQQGAAGSGGQGVGDQLVAAALLHQRQQVVENRGRCLHLLQERQVDLAFVPPTAERLRDFAVIPVDLHQGMLGYRLLLSPDEEIGSVASGPVLADFARRGHVGLTYEPALADGALASARKGSGNFHIVVHGRAAHAGRDFAAGRNTRSHVWFRWFNEIPVIVLLAVIVLVVLKPF